MTLHQRFVDLSTVRWGKWTMCSFESGGYSGLHRFGVNGIISCEINGLKEVLHILCDDRPLETYPSVYNALYLWHGSGWRNSIATGAKCDEFIEYIEDVFVLPLAYFDRARQLSRLKKSFDVIIAYDFHDLEILSLATMLGRGPAWHKLVHHSLELPTYYFDGFGVARQVHKTILRYGMSKVDVLVIQDELRLSVVNRLFPKLATREHFLVPNSYIPAIEPMAASLPWYDEIRKKARWLVLYTGALERWSLPHALLKEIREIRDVTFVFSGWCRDGSLSEIMDLCSGCDHIIFSTDIKSRADLNYMVAHCDIGLAYYAAVLDDNIKYMGLSSGKFHKYLSFDKPVLINRVPLLGELIETNGLGLLVELGSFRNAIEEMIAQYAHFQQDVRRYYAETWSFERQYNKLIEGICL